MFSVPPVNAWTCEDETKKDNIALTDKAKHSKVAPLFGDSDFLKVPKSFSSKLNTPTSAKVADDKAVSITIVKNSHTPLPTLKIVTHPAVSDDKSSSAVKTKESTVSLPIPSNTLCKRYASLYHNKYIIAYFVEFYKALLRFNFQIFVAFFITST